MGRRSFGDFHAINASVIRPNDFQPDCILLTSRSVESLLAFLVEKVDPLSINLQQALGIERNIESSLIGNDEFPAAEVK